MPRMASRTPAGRGLLGALAYFGLDHIATTQKDSFRDCDAWRPVEGSRTRGDPRLLRERRVALDRLLLAWPRRSTCRGLLCGGAIWRRRLALNGTESRSTGQHCGCCGAVGMRSKPSWSTRSTRLRGLRRLLSNLPGSSSTSPGSASLGRVLRAVSSTFRRYLSSDRTKRTTRQPTERVARQPFANACSGAERGFRWPKPRAAVGLWVTDRPQPAQQHQVHLRT